MLQLFIRVYHSLYDPYNEDRNPRHFPEPEKFDPSRWDKGIESFLGFSVGPRSCLGRKFATVEMVCFVSLILRDWKVEPLLLEGETVEEWKKRVFKVELGMTLTIRHIPIKLTRRVKGKVDNI